MDFDNENEFKVDLQAAINHPDLMAITKVTAIFIKNNGYHSVGKFLQALTDADLKSLLDVVDQQFEAADEDLIDDYENIVLLTLMLADAEGVGIESVEQLSSNTNIFGVLLTMEGLKRKGLVTLMYDKISFGEDFKHEVVCRKTDKMDDWLADE